MSTSSWRPHVRLPGTGEVNTAFGLAREFLVTAEDSAGALTVWTETVPPGAGPPLHRHLREHEIFHVIQGKVLFACDAARVEIATGGVIMIPPASPHGFFNLGAEPARLMVTMSPGGLEGLFREVQAAQLDGRADASAIEAIARRYHLEITGPPLTP
jgi:mannose-6-phosphate isomerase-like protein (cupin superfamily)